MVVRSVELSLAQGLQMHGRRGDHSGQSGSCHEVDWGLMEGVGDDLVLAQAAAESGHEGAPAPARGD